MSINNETFLNYRKKIESAITKEAGISEKKLDEAAKLLLLNAQFLVSYLAFQEKAGDLSENQIAEFDVSFESQVKDFEDLVHEYVNSITH